MTEGDILLTSEREARYSNKKREKKNKKVKKENEVLEKSHQWVYIRTYKATRAKNANYITEYRDRLDHAHHD